MAILIFSLLVGSIKQDSGSFKFLECISWIENMIVENMGEGAVVLSLINSRFLFCFPNYRTDPGCRQRRISTPPSPAQSWFSFLPTWSASDSTASSVKHFLGPVWWLAPAMLPIESSATWAGPFRSRSVSSATSDGRTILLIFFGLVRFLFRSP
jgi:F-type H+-transporting ATPase subunit a